ncbi:MAG: hypothetical protein KIG63_06735 [Methanobrevibacter sp.]|nr:hypothetical protein [Methanobrevibacter sp.]
MKKIVLAFFSLILFSAIIFASEVTDLLEKAKISYSNGKLTETINLIDSAKKLVERENINTSSEEYIEVTNWDVIKIKKSEYIGKKVKVKARFYGINSDGTTVHISIGLSCTYDNSLVDKFLELAKYQEYVFFGTVFENNTLLGPMIHIEAIE